MGTRHPLLSIDPLRSPSADFRCLSQSNDGCCRLQNRPRARDCARSRCSPLISLAGGRLWVQWGPRVKAPSLSSKSPSS
ncbi:hypothetical protein LIA77_08505 [Sarocladium implicatum]|nr:hypothetical protein LIA77_08505 [Sarocladium implicatum]